MYEFFQDSPQKKLVKHIITLVTVTQKTICISHPTNVFITIKNQFRNWMLEVEGELKNAT